MTDPSAIRQAGGAAIQQGETQATVASVIVGALLAGVMGTAIWWYRRKIGEIFCRWRCAERTFSSTDESDHFSRDAEAVAVLKPNETAVTSRAVEEDDGDLLTLGPEPFARQMSSSSTPTIRPVTPDGTKGTTCTGQESARTATSPKTTAYTPSHYRSEPPDSIAHNARQPPTIAQDYSTATFLTSPEKSLQAPRIPINHRVARNPSCKSSELSTTSFPSPSKRGMLAMDTPSIYSHDPPGSVPRPLCGEPPSLPQDYSIATFDVESDLPPWAYLSVEDVVGETGA